MKFKKAQLFVLFSLVCLSLGAQKVTLDVSQEYIPILECRGDTLISSIAYGNHWVLDGVEIEDAFNQTLINPKPGVYQVFVVDLRTGCVTYSDPVTYAPNSTPRLKAADFKFEVFPNPNKGLFNLSIQVLQPQTARLDLLSVEGKKLMEKNVDLKAGKQEVAFGKNELPDGVYTVRIDFGTRQMTKKVIVEQSVN